MRSNVRWIVPVLALAFGAAALGERPTEPAAEATHVVTGTADKVFVRDSGADRQYVVRIRIDGIEKGDGFEEGDYVYAYAFKRKPDQPPQPAASGHRLIPREGQRVRAWIKRGKGQMEALYPNGFEILKAPGAK